MSEPDSSTTASPFGEHQLAAIVFTDVVDYSARMGRDAAGTLQAVEADFKRLRKLCAHYGGTVHNTMGDGMLMCFKSATHAVVCALRAQQEFAARARRDPEALRHRIGIHLGDIILGSEGVAGDGVNIAARILTLATPGGACVSEAVHRAVRSQLKLKVESLGAPQLKNIAEPVSVCRVDVEESKLPMRTRVAMNAKPARALAIGAAVVLAAGLAGGVWWTMRKQEPVTAGAAAKMPTATAVPTLEANSIAVLPFVDMSAARDQEYLADGIADELITTLGRIPGVRVASRSSAFVFKGQTMSATALGKELKVAKLLEGTIRRSEKRLRISVRLTNAADGLQLWAENFDREPKDVLTLQVEIARTIAQKLQGTLGSAAREGVDRLATDSAEAYTFYLRGRHLLSRRTSELSEAQRLFESAIAADEYYAAAYSGLAECHVLRVFFGRTAMAEAAPLVRKAAERALELDLQQPDAEAALGFVRLFHDWDTRAADDLLGRALERNPDHGPALAWRAVARLNRGDVEGAVALATRLAAADPNSPLGQAWSGWVLLLAGRPAEAKARLEKARELEGNFSLAHAWLGQQAEAVGDLAGAVAHYEAGLQRSAGNAVLLAHLARAKGLQGKTDEARARLAELSARSERGYVRAYLLAVARSGLGEAETTAVLDALERAVAERDVGIATLRQTTIFDAVRGQERFRQLERSVGGKLWSARMSR